MPNNKEENYHELYTQALCEKFTVGFTKIYKTAEKHQRDNLLSNVSNIFRRWYHSALIEDTYLSPANLMEALNRRHGAPPAQTPVPRLCEGPHFAGVNFALQDYSLANHPAVADFRIFIDCLRPDVSLTEEDHLPPEMAQTILAKLHLQDPAYLDYFMALAVGMNILDKMPSIHTNRAYVTKDADALLALSDIALFSELVEAGLYMATFAIEDTIPLPENFFDEAYLHAILENPTETDMIFQAMYHSMGVDLNDLQRDKLHELDMPIISSTYMLGTVLDRFFFTPFGYYFKLIRPIYVLPFDFETEMGFFLDLALNEDEAHDTFYAPCTYYFLTDLGLAYFQKPPASKAHLDLGPSFPFEQVALLFFTDMHLAHPGHEKPTVPDSHVYTLKIKAIADPRLWVNLEIPAQYTLHELCKELAVFFNIDPNDTYQVYTGEEENPFTAYASPNQAKRPKQATETSLCTLKLEKGQVLTLETATTLRNEQRNAKWRQKWRIEVLKVDYMHARYAYPRVARMGKAVQESLEWEE